MKEQRRARRLAMSEEERDTYLLGQRTCRIGTLCNGRPHLSAAWFIWHEGAVWINSVVQSQRWTDIGRHAAVSVLIDDGHGFMELRGVEIVGQAEVIGEVPRSGEPVAALAVPERLFAEKYADGTFRYDGRHAWFRVQPEKIVSWDFRKMGGT